MLSAFYSGSHAENETGQALAECFREETEWIIRGHHPLYLPDQMERRHFPGTGQLPCGSSGIHYGFPDKRTEKEIQPWAEEGFRVLLVAAYDGIPEKSGLTESALHPMALVIITNRLRKEAAETFRYFKEQGVCIKVISGDSPSTVSEVAKQAGIEGAKHYVDASQLKTDSSLEAAAEKYTVFGRGNS